MSLRRYSGGAWTDCESVRKYSGGAWADCESVKKYSSGAWGNVWEGNAVVQFSEEKFGNCIEDRYRFAYIPSGEQAEFVIEPQPNQPNAIYTQWKPKVFAPGEHTISMSVSALEGISGQFMTDYMAHAMIVYMETDGMVTPFLYNEIYHDKAGTLATTKFTLPNNTFPRLYIGFEYFPMSDACTKEVRVFFRNLVIDGKNINFGGQKEGAL